MMSNVLDVQPFLYAVRDEARASLITEVLDAWKAQVVPVLPSLERGAQAFREDQKCACKASMFGSKIDNLQQLSHSHLGTGIIHGDCNEQNVIASPNEKNPNTYDVAAILDFGDIQENCYLFEVSKTS